MRRGLASRIRVCRRQRPAPDRRSRSRYARRHSRRPSSAQPATVPAALTANADAIRTASAMVAASRRVRLCGVGASGHAAQVGEHLLRSIGIDARAVNAFDLAVYPTNFDPGELLIVYTHRGGANYTTRALSRAIRAGLKTIAITGRDAEGVRADVTIATVPVSAVRRTRRHSTAAMAATAALCARCEPRAPLASAMPALAEFLRAMLPSQRGCRRGGRVMTAPERRTLVMRSGRAASDRPWRSPFGQGGGLSGG